jgi:hypothetical protein
VPPVTEFSVSGTGDPNRQWSTSSDDPANALKIAPPLPSVPSTLLVRNFESMRLSFVKLGVFV